MSNFYDDLSLYELKLYAKNRGLSVSGTKYELDYFELKSIDDLRKLCK